MDSKLRWTVVIVILLLGVGFLIFILAPRKKPSDEEQIRQMFIQAERDVNQGNTSGLLSIVSRNYHDERGFNFPTIRALLAQWQRSRERANVTVYNLGLQIEGKQASISALVTVEFNSNTKRELNISAELAKETKGWKVVSANGWQESSLGEDF
jgi:hypothetical protein